MKLTQEQQALLNGEKGQTMAKVMKTLVMYGEIFGAEKMVPVTSRYNHLVTSFGLKALGPVYDLMDQLIAAGAVSGQKFSADPRPLDPKVPANFLQNLVFKKFMYSKQGFYEGQLKTLGLKDEDAFSCACYLDEQGNRPAQGEVLSWAESSAVVYANSVLGARCNHRRLRAILRPAHRRGPQGLLGGEGPDHRKARGPAAGLRHRHEGDGGRALCGGSGPLAGQ